MTLGSQQNLRNEKEISFLSGYEGRAECLKRGSRTAGAGTLSLEGKALRFFSGQHKPRESTNPGWGERQEER